MREEILQKFHAQLRSHPDREKVYENIHEHAAEIFGNDYSIITYEEKMKVAWSHGIPTTPAKMKKYRFGDDSLVGVLDKVFSEEQAYITRTREVGKGEYDLQSALVVPLFYQGECVGTLVFGRNDARKGFRSTDLELGRFLGDELTLAIEEQLTDAAMMERRSRQAKNDKKLVLTLQEILLPPTNPQVPNLRVSTIYRTAREESRLGGDFYDVFSVPQNNIAVIMGDVVGHGLGAARITALVKYTLRAFAYEGSTPAEIIRRANKVISPQIDENELVTLLFGVYNAKEKSFTYASAGHYFPMVVNKSGNAYRPLERLCSPPLGVLEEGDEGHYREITTNFTEGDLLFLYTDGVIEARNSVERGDFYGQERLFETVRAHAHETPSVITKEVMRDLTEFSGGKFRDDAAIMTIKHKHQPKGRGCHGDLGFVRDHVSLPAHSERLNSARDFVINLAEAVGFNEDEVFSIRLAVGEAIINAMEHGSEDDAAIDIITTWENHKQNLNVQVRDRGRAREHLVVPTESVEVNGEALNTRGRGMLLIESCMDAYKMQETKHGMLVTMDKKLPSRNEETEEQ